MEELLAVPGVRCDVRDNAGDTPLHFAAAANCPMSAYALAKSQPGVCLIRNNQGCTAADAAKARSFGEVKPKAETVPLLLLATLSRPTWTKSEVISRYLTVTLSHGSAKPGQGDRCSLPCAGAQCHAARLLFCRGQSKGRVHGSSRCHQIAAGCWSSPGHLGPEWQLGELLLPDNPLRACCALLFGQMSHSSSSTEWHSEFL